MNIDARYMLAMQWNSLQEGRSFEVKAGKFQGRKESMAMAQQEKAGTVTVRRTVDGTSYMMRIAQARTPSQVAAIIRMARAEMQFVKRCNSSEESIKKAMRILKQVIAKGKMKIKGLKAEEELEEQERVAQNRDQENLERAIREKKNRKKQSRCAREAADTCNQEKATVSRTTHINSMSFSLAGVAGTAAGEASVAAGTAEAAVAGTAVGTSVEALV